MHDEAAACVQTGQTGQTDQEAPAHIEGDLA
jgi:hypothetical protein